MSKCFMNRQAFTFTHNRDGEKLRLPERMLLAVCRPVEAPSLSVPTVNYSVENSLDFAKKMIPRFLPRIQGKTVLDYGCGPGWQAVAMRLAGARRVHGVEINDQMLAHGRGVAARAGGDGVTFRQTAHAAKDDVAISQCGMAHYRHP